MSYPSCQTKELKGLTVKQLQSLAKREGLNGYTKLKKDELCREIAKRLSAKGKSAPKSAMKKSSGGPKKSVRFTGDKKRLIAVWRNDTLQIVAPDGFYPGDSESKLRKKVLAEASRQKPACTLCFTPMDEIIDAVYELMAKDDYLWIQMDGVSFAKSEFAAGLTGRSRVWLK